MGIFKKRTKADVQSKRPLTDRTKGANGECRKRGVEVTFKDGDTITLLTPSGKGAKFAQELKEGVHLTNDMQTVKADSVGVVLPVTPAQRAYRAGYLDAQKDSAKAYNAKNKK